MRIIISDDGFRYAWEYAHKFLKYHFITLYTLHITHHNPQNNIITLITNTNKQTHPVSSILEHPDPIVEHYYIPKLSTFIHH